MNVYIAALVFTLTAYALSYLWYGPLLFKKLYERELEKTVRAEPHPRLFVFFLFFVLTFTALSTLGYFVLNLPERNFFTGASLGIYFWLFYMTLDFANALFSRASLILRSINWAYWLIVAFICGGLFGIIPGPGLS